MRNAARILVRIGLWLGVAFFGSLGVFAVFASQRAYDEATLWFFYATYQSECAPGQPSEGTAGCSELATSAPDWPEGVPITDRDLLLTLGSAAHNTATAVLTVSGLFLAMAALLVAVAAFLPRAPRAVARAEMRGE